MFLRGYSLRVTAVLFLLILFVLIAGLLAYTIWYSPPREPPRRSRPVAVTLTTNPVTKLNSLKGGSITGDYGSQSN